MKGCTTLALMFGAFAVASAGTGHQEALTIFVQDHLAMQGYTLRRAAEIAERILHEQGVYTEWKTCHCTDSEGTSQCQCPPGHGGPSLFLAILPKPLREHPAHPGAMGMAAVGHSGGPATHAYIYYRRVLEVAELVHCDAFQILGHAIAHEIGHLLGNKHSKWGIMRANWNRAMLSDMRRGYVLFASDEGRTMQANVATRLLRQRASR